MALGVAGLLKRSAQEFATDEAPVLASSLAFYTALALAPLLVILISIAGLVGPDAQRQFITQVTSVMGRDAGEMVNSMVSHAAARQHAGIIASIIGILTLILGASGVFAQLQFAMNRIWDVKAKPGQGVKGWARKRVISVAMLGAIAFILIASLAVTGVVSMFIGGEAVLAQVVNFVVSYLVVAVLFAVIFKYLPDAEIRWRDVWIGALITALLFEIGKFAIGLYLGRATVGSAYGAAGSLVILLLWVYYAAMIVFFGAEFTQVWAAEHGREIVPEKHAEWETVEDKPGGEGPPKPAPAPG
jgi:membrane protein